MTLPFELHGAVRRRPAETTPFTKPWPRRDRGGAGDPSLLRSRGRLTEASLSLRCRSAQRGGLLLGRDQRASQRRKGLRPAELSVGESEHDQGQTRPVRGVRISTPALCDRVPGRR